MIEVDDGLVSTDAISAVLKNEKDGFDIIVMDMAVRVSKEEGLRVMNILKEDGLVRPDYVG